MCTALGHQHGQHYSSDSAVHRPATPAGWHSAAISYSSALWGGQDLRAHDLYLLLPPDCNVGHSLTLFPEEESQILSCCLHMSLETLSWF